MRALSIVFGVLAMLMSMTVYAFAQVVEASSTMVDLSGILNMVIDIVAAILIVVVPVLVTHYVKKWFGIRLEERYAASLTGIVERGVTLGKEKAKAVGKDVAKIDVRNEVVAEALNYAIAQAPDAVKYFGLSPEQVSNMARARLEDKLGEATSLPTVTPNPAPK